jgi:DNA modification methylase
MAKILLTDEEIKKLIECIQDGTEVPEDLVIKLSPSFFDKLRSAGKFDYKELDRFKIPTIEYAGKRPESVILAQAALTGGAAPLQVVRSFGESSENEWRNMIVQGDNLQFLKTCYMNQDPLIKDKVKGKVKLVYIDPPFATKSDFQASDGADSYSDKIDRAEFIESLRERLIYIREVLADDGSIFVHLDLKQIHYIKIVMDEIFGRDKFVNEIIWYYPDNFQGNVKGFATNHNNILWYSKSKNFISNKVYVPLDKKTKRDKRVWSSELGKLVSARNEDGSLIYEEFTEKKADDVWSIGQSSTTKSHSSEYINYPTQKPEELLKRSILASSNPGDLIVDFFAGSGTTAAVAEKLGRRWITCDFGKHAIYTMQKRILNIADSNNLDATGKKEKYNLPPKPFDIISAGAYDFSKIMNLRQNKDSYIAFVLGLFGLAKEDSVNNKYKLPDIYALKDGNPVEIYPVWDDEYLKEVRIDEEYLEQRVYASGGRLKGDYYIITPETCTLIGDTTIKNSQGDNIYFHMLKFPYKILEDVSRHFQIEEQPCDANDINRLISSTGFYFNEDVKIEIKRRKNGFKIESFSTNILDSNKERYEGLNGLSMILIDLNYNNKVFNMDMAVYAKDIKEDGVIKISGINDNTAIIAIDRHGNESKVIRM